MGKIIISKEVKALLPIINKEETRPYFRGFLIRDNSILATDSRILVRMQLNNEIPKEDIPTNIQTGSDTDKVWISIDTLKKALNNISKKSSLPTIQENIYVNKANGNLKIQILDEKMNIISFEERGYNEDFANSYPDTDKILNSAEQNEQKQILKISGEIIVKLAEMVKSLGKELIVSLEISDYKRPVLFKIKEKNNKKIDGAFVLLKTEE